MTSSGNDTIAAIATPPGGGIGIVRVSGPRALALASGIFRGRGGRSLASAPPRLLLLGEVVDPATGETIDEVFAVHMSAGRSFTGEPTVEIQGHGGRVVLESVLRATLGAGARLAAPGEFTKRAFLYGRIDLTQAEAIAELIGAASEEEGRLAILQLRGGLATAIREIRGRLLELVAATEAVLDFGEEDGDGEVPPAGAVSALAADIRALATLGKGSRCGASGARVVIAGRPNSGKSSLFNMLSRCERSIVSPVPGTTRDYVEERATVGGASLTLVDTAGIRACEDSIEAEGVFRTRRQITEADVVVLLIDGSEPDHADDVRLIGELLHRSPLLVISKVDLPVRLDLARLRQCAAPLPHHALSALTGEGCAPFIEALAARCRETSRVSVSRSPEPAPNLRHQEALRKAGDFLDVAADILSGEEEMLDQAAAELRAALGAIGEITGETASEEIVERIFRRFCIGK